MDDFNNNNFKEEFLRLLEIGSKPFTAAHQNNGARRYFETLEFVQAELDKLTEEIIQKAERRSAKGVFYFFWRSSKAPILSWINSKIPSLEEYLDMIPPEATLQDVFIHKGVASQRYRPYQFILENEGLTQTEFSQKFRKGTIAKYLEKHDLIDKCIAWLKLHYPGDKFSVDEASNTRFHVMILDHIKKKLAMGLGYWDDSIKFMGDSFTAVIKKNLVSAIHPSQDRFLSVRETLHLMGFPHDFEITELKHLRFHFRF